MFTEHSDRAKGLGVVGIAVMALVIGAWTLPSGAGNEGRTMTADINFPAAVQDGQECQAYGLAYNGTSPYVFTWSGQFDNSYGEPGALGEDQIVNGLTSSSRGNSLTLIVEDSSTPLAQVDTTTVNWMWDDEENEECSQ